MKVCVGAVSKRVVEEAANMQVAQIVASRRQIDCCDGYTGFDQYSLADTVNDLSFGQTLIVRDHGGPLQGKVDDHFSVGHDIEAGFHAIHWDVSHLSRTQQDGALKQFIIAHPETVIEIGGERDDQAWLYHLLEVALAAGGCVESCVVQTGAHIHADRQQGLLVNPSYMQYIVDTYHDRGVLSKAHNFDWLGGRHRWDCLDLCNIAPELARVEIETWLQVLSCDDGELLLNLGYKNQEGARWFNGVKRPCRDRAICGARYILERADVKQVLDRYDDSLVREEIREAIRNW